MGGQAQGGYSLGWIRSLFRQLVAHALSRLAAVPVVGLVGLLGEGGEGFDLV